MRTPAVAPAFSKLRILEASFGRSPRGRGGRESGACTAAAEEEPCEEGRRGRAGQCLCALPRLHDLHALRAP